ncbi:MAG: DivIVA domain-containing protein [Ruminococcaceae bacterium]|nr:DivIVA domain-containing protein [Oscillospiraceae bacterium]
MLTLDQIKNVTFSKARGGYSTAEVDDFIDQCVDTLASVLDERNTANKKMEVLADKLKEYRNEEDSIRSALVNAQRLGDTIVREANQKAVLTQEDAAIKAEKIVKEAEEKAATVLAGITDEVKAQEAELKRLKQEVSLFKERMLSIYREHLSLIQVLPEEEEEAPADESAEDTVASEEIAVEEAVDAVAEVPSVAEEIVEPAAVEPIAPVVEEPTAVTSLEALVEAEPEAVEEAPKSRFADLQFGDDYDNTQDEEKPRGFFRRKK